MSTRRIAACLAATMLVAAACNSSTIPNGSDTTLSTGTTSGNRITLFPNSTPFILEGARGAYVVALQFYLVCTGHEEPSPGATVSVDGAYGPITADAVAYYQAELQRVPSGEPDEETFASLARDCNRERTLELPEGSFATEIAGNVDSGDAEIYTFSGSGGQVMTFGVADGTVSIAVFAADGTEVDAAIEGNEVQVQLDAPQAYTIRVSANTPTSYRIAISLRSPNVVAAEFGPMTLEPAGIGIAAFGDDPVNTVAVIALLLGAPLADTGWEEPGVGECTGLNRHVSWLIQGATTGDAHPAVFSADFTDDGESATFVQYSYQSFSLEGLDPIAQGLTTPEGITIGMTLAQYRSILDPPQFFDTALGLAREGEYVVGFDLVGGIADPDPTATQVWYISAGADGCPDF